MKLEIITPDQTLFKGEVDSLYVPGKKGPFTVLHNHAPIISILEKGPVKFIPHGQAQELISIQGGVIEVKRNTIIILADLE
ncbi:MAG: ATP synthase F1 subunit epsilon [Bacteroidales bacterium]|nr:ATP synthase F1 subunit epsilon [Bacteroidales bacterium]